MNKAFQRLSPFTQHSILAVILGTLGFSFAHWGSTAQLPTQDALRIALLLAALTYLSNPCIESALAMVQADPRKGWRNPYRWLHAYHLGYGITVAIVLMIVVPDATPETFPLKVLIFALCGIVFGGFFAARSKDLPAITHYDTDRGLNEKAWFKAIVFAWPFVLIILMTRHILDYANGKADIWLISFMAILLGTLPRVANPKFEGNSWSWSATKSNGSYLVGLVLATSAVLAF